MDARARDLEHAPRRMRLTVVGMLGLWSVAVLCSLAWNIRQVHALSEKLATEEGRSAVSRDLMFRRWVSNLGGVYAPADKIAPNPYLKIEARDVETTDGRTLTLVNPAYMTRMVYEMHAQASGIQGHITSAKPLRPENRPDPWELSSLQAFEAGTTEHAELLHDDRGQESLRYMKAFFVEEGCLKCHGDQGYALGDVRGGVSILVPMAPFRSLEHGQIASMLVVHFALWALGTIALLWGSARLRTERELALQAEQRALEASAAKTAFIANISHEIRTPINGILGLASELERHPLALDEADSVATIRSCGEALLRQVNDLLDLSKVESGRLEIERIPFAPRELFESLCGLIRPGARAKSLDVVTTIAPDVPEQVLGDPNRLRQILLNLVHNALKFTERGAVHLDLEVRTEASTQLCFTVEDTGIGIAPEALERIFEPFAQADASTTRLYGGTGLGLSICKRLAEASAARSMSTAPSDEAPASASWSPSTSVPRSPQSPPQVAWPATRIAACSSWRTKPSTARWPPACSNGSASSPCSPPAGRRPWSWSRRSTWT